MRHLENHFSHGSMPPKLDPDTVTRRLNLVASASWVRKIDDWRRHQPDLPNISEAIRRLVEIGLKAKKWEAGTYHTYHRCRSCRLAGSDSTHWVGFQ